MISAGELGLPADQPRLLADVGGTHARFASQAAAGAAIEATRVYRCAEHASLEAAARHYLAEVGRPAPQGAAIGIANPVTGDLVRMTNHGWSFSIEALRGALRLRRLVVLNDFAALALALPVLAPGECVRLFGGESVATAPKALIGPGTGLGVSGLVPEAGRWLPLHTEGGHVSLAPATAREWAVVQWLQRRFGHASAERALSGPGLRALWLALAALDGGADAGGGVAGVVAGGVAADASGDAGADTAVVADRADMASMGDAAPTPAEIVARASAGGDARCTEVLALFFEMLGGTAGNLALSLGARGGLYLGGGILPRLAEALRHSNFHRRFVDKGRMRGYLEQIPVYLIQAEELPALRGAAQAL